MPFPTRSLFLIAALALAACALAIGTAHGQADPANPFGRAHSPRSYRTVRLQGSAPRIDGRLDDAAWREGEWSGGYTQQLPTEGAQPSARTELKILFDTKNVYVAIRAFDDPEKMHRYPSRRDSLVGDIVGVCFDSYFDKRSGFEFDLNAAGTKTDLVLTNEGWDTSWDAVWYGKVGVEQDAWTAEFQIPLNQLRYAQREDQVWGLHAWRWIDRHQEEDQWNLIPRNSTGRMYNLGELHGIEASRGSRHVELLPHAVARVTAEPGAAAAGSGTLGLDAKVALTTDFTLDATVNPDFGQVEADPSVVNLTAYETFFEEKRPFFIEGRRIFTFALEPTTIAGDNSDVSGDMLFYSRRVGHAPGYTPPLAPGETFAPPESTSILSAVKVTGKTRDGLSVGVLQSLTGEESAVVSLNGAERRQPIEPRASYIAARVQKDWSKGNTILGGMFTSTDRVAGNHDFSFMARHAVSGGADLVRFFGNRSYVLEGKATFSYVEGDRLAIEALQTNAVHYFQRPDATHLHLDPTATSLSGHGGTVRVARYGNSKWRASDTVRWVSPGLELNDVGYLRQADFIRHEIGAGFEQTEPRGPFRAYGIGVERGDNWDFGGLRTDGVSTVAAHAQFANKWTVSAKAHLIDTAVDTRLLRGGPAFTMQPFVATSFDASTDASRRAVLALGLRQHAGSTGALSATAISSGVRLRVSRAFNLSTDAYYETVTDQVQYVDTPQRTDGVRYILGRLHQDTLGLTIRADLYLTPDLSVQYYGSPFVSNGGYGAFKRVTDSRAQVYTERFHLLDQAEIRYEPALNRYRVTEAGATYSFANPDFSVREFRSNLVGRWEFRPGSTLFLVWSQDRSGAESAVNSLEHGFGALRREPATNVLLAKMTCWLPF